MKDLCLWYGGYQVGASGQLRWLGLEPGGSSSFPRLARILAFAPRHQQPQRIWVCPAWIPAWRSEKSERYSKLFRYGQIDQDTPLLPAMTRLSKAKRE